MDLRHALVAFVFLIVQCTQLARCGSSVPPFAPLCFEFGWQNNIALPGPISAQCETLPITWSRASVVGTPDPVAPYTIQIYSSALQQPLILDAGIGLAFNYTLPFPPESQFQMCMVDSLGNSGGCQEAYTIYPVRGASCSNATAVAPFLDVQLNQTDVDGVIGSLSEFGFPDQCTNLIVTPLSGVPPYTLTIAPSFHFPLNITSQTKAPITWQITFSQGTKFFVSLSDSAGATWSAGPLHSGGNGPTTCLSLTPETTTFTSADIGGSVVGGLVLGAVLTALTSWLLIHNRRRQLRTRLSGMSSDSIPDNAIVVNPFVDPRRNPAPRTSSAMSIDEKALPSIPSHTPMSDSSSNRQVYVIHHDGGRPPPVTVVTGEGASVVELPPRYIDRPMPDSPASISPPPTSSLATDRPFTRGERALPVVDRKLVLAGADADVPP